MKLGVHNFLLWHIFLGNFILSCQEQDTCVVFMNTIKCSATSTWAVNVPLLNVTHSYHIERNNLPSTLDYKLVLENTTILTLCRMLFVTETSCMEVDGTACLDCQITGNPSNNLTLVTRFFIVDINLAKNGSRLEYDSTSPSVRNQNFHTFNVSACESQKVSTTKQDSSFKIESTETPAHYKDGANCSCLNVEEDLYTVEGTKVDEKAKCEYDAEWAGCANLQCWSGPRNISAVQENFDVGASFPFNCTYTEGFPDVLTTIFKINNSSVSKNYVLKSYDHGKSLTCQVISNFTQKKDKPYLSSPKTILVNYPPENSTLSSDKLVMDLNDSKVLTYFVNANPSNGSVEISFTNGSDQNVTNMFKVFDKYAKEDDTLHIFRFNFTVTSDQDYGTYNVCASTKFPDGRNCATLSIRNAAMSTPLPDTATSSITTGSKNLLGPGLPPPVIGAIVAGAIVIMLIVVGIVIHKKRKQSSSKDSVKEETVNVLYGSAQYQTSSAENRGNVKQERSNVLYASTSGDGDLVEYATANLDGVASDDAIQHATSNPDVENTSAGAVASATSDAEPSCSGNTSVYAQINKKKGKVNDGYKIEMHDTSEATYTVVDKSKKRNKVTDNVPEVYAIVNKPRAKG